MKIRDMKIAIMVGVVLLATTTVSALPSQVVMIRHADKWAKNPGENLDPTGYLRAVKFSEYYFQKFHMAPDAIIATNPAGESGFREIQTLSPLANHVKVIKKNVVISHNYHVGQEQEQANAILTNPAYDGKNIVICWAHSHIGALLNALGVADKTAWPGKDFDTVYVLKFTKNGIGKPIVKWQKRDNQYPVPEIKHWKEYLDKMD